MTETNLTAKKTYPSKKSKKKHKKKARSYNGHVNRNYKDSLFRLLFADKEGALELYNALNHSSYDDPELIEITTIEDVIYMGIKNDVSFLVEGRMHLFEEQSSWSENMPLRGLFYFSNLYRSYLEKNQLDIYSSKRLPLPRPIYIVFYIGTAKKPEQMTLRLSDSFEDSTNGGKTNEPVIEVVARVLNVNYGKNRELLERCRRLFGYSYLISQVRHYMDQGFVLEAAMDRAIEDCITQDILKKFLLKHRGEVRDVILTRYDAKFHIKCEKELSREEGRIEGRQEGIGIGRREESCRIVKNMLSKGMSRDMILEMTGLSEAELDAIQGEINAAPTKE